MFDFSNKYLCDKEIAQLISMSPSWVRQQRHKRNNNQPHIMDVDCIYIGRSPRYKAEEVQEWLANLQGSSDAIN